MNRRRGPSPPVPPGERVFLLVFALPAVVIAVGLPLLSRATGVPLRDFTRDVFSIGEIPVWSGFVSNLGLALWTASVTVCAMAAALGRVPARVRGALIAAGALSSLLLVDDAFMFHEFLAPRHLGISEFVVVGAYGLLTVAWLATYRSEILDRRPGLLAGAFALLAVSIGMDGIEPVEAEWWRYWIEESAKLLGIVGWFGWLALFSADALRR